MSAVSRSTVSDVALTEVSHNEAENLPALFGRLGDEVMQLVDTKLNLLKAEVKEDAQAYVKGGIAIGTNALIATIGLALVSIAIGLFVSLLFSFSQPVNYALGFVIIGAVYLIGGTISMTVTKNRLANRDLIPERSVDELRKDKQWLKKDL